MKKLHQIKYVLDKSDKSLGCNTQGMFKARKLKWVVLHFLFSSKATTLQWKIVSISLSGALPYLFSSFEGRLYKNLQNVKLEFLISEGLKNFSLTTTVLYNLYGLRNLHQFYSSSHVLYFLIFYWVIATSSYIFLYIYINIYIVF